MKKRMLTGLLLALGAPFLASAACPAGTTPTTYLIGQTWAFRLVGITDPPDANAQGISIPHVDAIGTFTAAGPGYLAIVETVAATIDTTDVRRLAPTSGRWAVNSDCSGGQLGSSRESLYSTT